MKHTPPQGSWQDNRQSPASTRSSAVDPADLTPESLVRCRICERTPFTVGQTRTTGDLITGPVQVFMLLTDADNDAPADYVVARAICRPCAVRIDELNRSRPLLEVLIRSLLWGWGQRNTNGHPPPAPRLVAAMSQAAANGYMSSVSSDALQVFSAHLAGTRDRDSGAPEALVEGVEDADIALELAEADDPESPPWDRMVLAALPTLAAGERIGLPKWRIIGVAGVWPDAPSAKRKKSAKSVKGTHAP